jgi:hypothetical protein
MAGTERAVVILSAGEHDEVVNSGRREVVGPLVIGDLLAAELADAGALIVAKDSLCPVVSSWVAFELAGGRVNGEAAGWRHTSPGHPVLLGM